MKKLFFLCAIIVLTFSNSVLASAVSGDKKLVSPNDCSNLLCVRNNIDIIDADIVRLIGLRLTYVKRAGELKGKQPIHDQKREEQIILKVTQLASKAGYPGSIAAEVYKTILAQANIYEQQVQRK